MTIKFEKLTLNKLFILKQLGLDSRLRSSSLSDEAQASESNDGNDRWRKKDNFNFMLKHDGQAINPVILATIWRPESELLRL